MERYAIIMAGGTGSRLWPLSREKRPKQFIDVEDGACMLVQTVKRIRSMIPLDKCFIITNKNLLNITQETLGETFPFENILLEPVRKNTAACIAYAAMLIGEKFGPGTLCFVPADGYVKSQNEYETAVERAFQAAETTDKLVVIGITPLYAATGYGYIQIDKQSDETVNAARNFIEKPNSELAGKMLASKEFLWNSGIVVGSTSAFSDEIKEYLPEHYKKLAKALRHRSDPTFYPRLEKAYARLPELSFDKAVLEKSSPIYVVKGDFDWDDIGSLNALAKTFASGEGGNRVKGDHLEIDTANSVIYSEEIPIATIGVENMIIAATKDSILVCPRDRAQDIKSLVGLLEKRGYKNLI